MWKSGDRVLAKWAPDGFWYPGTVVESQTNRCFVHFDDGDSAWSSLEDTRSLSLGVGQKVLGRWKGGPYCFPGVIAEKDGDRIHIHYDDGDREWTTIRSVRIAAAHVSNMQTPQ